MINFELLSHQASEGRKRPFIAYHQAFPVVPNMRLQLSRVSTDQLDIEHSKKLKSSLERKMGYGYNVLAEVKLILKALENSPTREIPQEIEEQVREDEFTGACEASGGLHIWSGHRQWDPEKQEFLAFGRSFVGMLRAGVEAIKEKVNQSEENKKYAFELERREAELQTAQWIGKSYPQGLLKNAIIFSGSTYPEKKASEDISDEIADATRASLGYKPRERLAKMRFEVFVNNVLQTVELSVAKGSVRIFQKLVEGLGYDPTAYSDSVSFLQKPINLGDSSNHLDVIVGLARKYDSLLEREENNGSLYFCGQEVKTPGEKKYEEIVARQRWVRERGGLLIDWVFDLDCELARSLHSGHPTDRIKDYLKYWLSAQDSQGAEMLHEEESRVLSQIVSSDTMSLDGAFALKKNELVRMWSIMACVINEDQAVKLFSKQQVSMVQKMVSGQMDRKIRLEDFRLIDEMIARNKPLFIACGGSLDSFGGGRERLASLFQSPLMEVRNILFPHKRQALGGGGESELPRFECPRCGYKADEAVGDTCPPTKKNKYGQSGCGLKKGEGGYATCN